MNIPRDPGTTYAFNAGVGLGRQVGGTTFAIDAIYEPMFSETWADAASDTATAGGGVIRAGGKTVENTFRFQNTRLRVGIGHDARSSADSASSVGFQLGLGVYSIDYRLKQRNNVQRTSRVQDERWIEWSPTFALRFRTSGFDLQYVFRMTCGPTACAPDFGGTTVTDAVAPGGGGVIAAPSGPLFFEGGRATSHQFLVSVPVR
jgi:hypothetical protein